MIMTQAGLLQSVQVGTPQRYGARGATDPMERPWKTSFFRTPGKEPRWLYTTHLEGNEQADKKHHGSLHQAVLMYAAAHYPAWQAELERQDIGPGGFGENFTVEGMSEETVCVGDIYAIGEAHIQVTGPRYPCSKIERRWSIPGLTARVAETGRTGWYCSVVQEGMIEPGMPVMLVERPYPRWTMALINDLGHSRSYDVELARELASCPLLDEWWQKMVVRGARKKAREAA